MTVHTCAHSKMPQHNIVNNVKLFSHELVSVHQYVHWQKYGWSLTSCPGHHSVWMQFNVTPRTLNAMEARSLPCVECYMPGQIDSALSHARCHRDWLGKGASETLNTFWSLGHPFRFGSRTCVTWQNSPTACFCYKIEHQNAAQWCCICFRHGSRQTFCYFFFKSI